jgi:hypothetical protein
MWPHASIGSCSRRRPWRMRIVSAFLMSGLAAILGPAVAEAATAADAAPGPDARIASTLASMRGLTLSNLPAAGRAALFRRLDAKWAVLMEDPDTTRRLARDILAREAKDGFLIIELSRLLFVLDDGFSTPGETATRLARVDPNVYPPAFFDLVSEMAARHCAECLPAALRMLSLKRLDAYLPAHDLPVDLELGLIFTIGQYGDAAVPGVLARLDSKDCEERGNAAAILAYLQPPAAPASIRSMALADGCSSARAKAWNSLGILGEPAIADLVKRRLATRPSPKPDEKVAMVQALTTARGAAAAGLLKQFQADPNPDVGRLAASARATQGRSRSQAGGGDGDVPANRSKAVALLEKAERRGRFRRDIDPAGFAALLLPEDLSLLNRARAALLGRLSDENLDAYFLLTRVAHELRVRVLAVPRSAATPARPGRRPGQESSRIAGAGTGRDDGRPASGGRAGRAPYRREGPGGRSGR